MLYVRFFVKEPEVWVENRRLQHTQKREVHAPLFSIFKRGMLANTLHACWVTASGFVPYYSVTVLFATHLQVDLKMSPGAIGEVGVAPTSYVPGQRRLGLGRRHSAAGGADHPCLHRHSARAVLFAHRHFTLIRWSFVAQGAAARAACRSAPAFMNERFPTERAPRRRVLLSPGRDLGWLVAPVFAYFATTCHLGYAIPMMVGTIAAATSFAVAIIVGPETKGKEMDADVVLA